MTPAFEFVLCLFAAHLIGDFVLQTNRMASGKRRISVLILHALIHAGMAYLLVGRWGAWMVPLVTAVSHAGIDRIKAGMAKPGALALILDQVAHVLVMGALALWVDAARDHSYWALAISPEIGRAWVMISGIILTVRVAGVFIGMWVQPYLREIEQAQGAVAIAPLSRGLTRGGSTIGQWERALIFLLVGVGQPGGIGFLIAAKSIFRFGELKDKENRMEAEYITIGTLMSFGWAMTTAYLTWWLVRL